MPRKTNSSECRLADARTVQLVGDLLRRGARTKTVERLTGLSEVPIRDVYREIFRSSPGKGPSSYSYTHFCETQVDQFQSSLVRRCIDTTMQVLGTKTLPRAPDLGRFYVQAYDLYIDHLFPLLNILEPLDFEKFAVLSLILAKRNVLSARVCNRCSTPFVAPSTPASAGQRHCPTCRIYTTRGCAKCNSYVPLDSGELQPKRRPMCPAHQRRVRPAGYGLPQYRSDESQTATPAP